MKTNTIARYTLYFYSISLLSLHMSILFFVRMMGCSFLADGIRIHLSFYLAFGVHVIFLFGSFISVLCSHRLRRFSHKLLCSLAVSSVLWIVSFTEHYVSENPFVFTLINVRNPNLYPVQSVGFSRISNPKRMLDFCLPEKCPDEEWILNVFIPAITNDHPHAHDIRFTQIGDLSKHSRWKIYNSLQSNSLDTSIPYLVCDGGALFLRGKGDMEEALSEHHPAHRYLLNADFEEEP